MKDGSMAPRGTGKTQTYQWYAIQYWILPMTGWNRKFIYLNKKPGFVKITGERKIKG